MKKIILTLVFSCVTIFGAYATASSLYIKPSIFQYYKNPYLFLAANLVYVTPYCTSDDLKDTELKAFKTGNDGKFGFYIYSGETAIASDKDNKLKVEAHKDENLSLDCSAFTLELEPTPSASADPDTSTSDGTMWDSALKTGASEPAAPETDSGGDDPKYICKLTKDVDEDAKLDIYITYKQEDDKECLVSFSGETALDLSKSIIDADLDLIDETYDNCPDISNPAQADMDKDNLGDLCDDDKDGDTVANDKDNCPNIINADQKDDDSDGVGDACDPDFSVSSDDSGSDCSLNPATGVNGLGWIFDLLMLGVPAVLFGFKRK